jgi:hypothetical protein
LLISFSPLLVSVFDFNVADAALDCAEKLSKLALLGNGLRETLLSGVIHKTIPGVDQEEEADNSGVVFFKNLLDGDKIFE